eukprot:1608357-Rhodomonas_salina.2
MEIGKHCSIPELAPHVRLGARVYTGHSVFITSRMDTSLSLLVPLAGFEIPLVVHRRDSATKVESQA